MSVRSILKPFRIRLPPLGRPVLQTGIGAVDVLSANSKRFLRLISLFLPSGTRTRTAMSFLL